MNVAHKRIVLKLNAQWRPVGDSTVADAIVDLVAGKCALALDIGYKLSSDGTPNFEEVDYMNPMTWDDWIKLPIRPWDLTISSSRLTIRVPTVIIAKNCVKMPKRKFRGAPSNEGVWIRDGGTCQYTNKRLKREEASVDHIIPRSKGGKDTWDNVVITSKEINRIKGNRLNEEIGLSLIREPRKPEDIDLDLTIREPKHEDWIHFLRVRDNR